MLRWRMPSKVVKEKRGFICCWRKKKDQCDHWHMHGSQRMFHAFDSWLYDPLYINLHSFRCRLVVSWSWNTKSGSLFSDWLWSILTEWPSVLDMVTLLYLTLYTLLFNDIHHCLILHSLSLDSRCIEKTLICFNTMSFYMQVDLHIMVCGMGRIGCRQLVESLMSTWSLCLAHHHHLVQPINYLYRKTYWFLCVK